MLLKRKFCFQNLPNYLFSKACKEESVLTEGGWRYWETTVDHENAIKHYMVGNCQENINHYTTLLVVTLFLIQDHYNNLCGIVYGQLMNNFRTILSVCVMSSKDV